MNNLVANLGYRNRQLKKELKREQNKFRNLQNIMEGVNHERDNYVCLAYLISMMTVGFVMFYGKGSC